MAYWTVLCEADGRHFGLTLDTAESTWVAGGPAVSEVFQTKSGRYIVKAAPEQGTYLLPSTGNEAVAIITAMTGTTPVGSTGRGKQFQTGLTFNWKLDSK
jgi:hypothetical protein